MSTQHFTQIGLIAFFLLLFVGNGHAQDVIYKKDGVKIEAKVQEIGTSEIRYKKFSNLDGPVYVIFKSQVSMIIYENGTHEVIDASGTTAATTGNTTTVEPLPPFDPTEYNKRKNLIGINYLDFLFANISISYERLFADGTWGIKVPFIYGFGGGTNRPNNNVFSSGIGINYYPGKPNVARYYTGATLRLGIVKEREEFWNLTGQWVFEEVQKNYYGVYFMNGLLIQMRPNINLSFELGLGVTDRNTHAQPTSGAIVGASTIVRF